MKYKAKFGQQVQFWTAKTPRSMVFLCPFFLSMEFGAVADSGEERNVPEAAIFTEWYATRRLQNKYLLKTFPSDDNERLDWASEIWNWVNCNNFTHCVQNNSYFKLFKHEAMIIQSVSLLYCRSQNNAVWSIHIPWLAQYHRHTVTSLLAGLRTNRCWKFGEGKHFFFTPKHADQFWHPTSIPLNRCLCIFPG